jgi:N-acetylneuraminic acid mutarotase
MERRAWQRTARTRVVGQGREYQIVVARFVIGLLLAVCNIATAAPWMWAGTTGTLDMGCGGIYGTQGVANGKNRPSVRDDCASWIDNSGSLWLFGGRGTDIVGTWGDQDDLWKYDPVSGQWIWMKGSNYSNGAAHYGSLGIPAAANTPGARHGGIEWTDAAGNFWLFGGLGPGGYRNDLWRYEPGTGNWTWMKGSTVAEGGDYGIQGVPSGSSRPGGRVGSVSWIDGSGALWLFGGYGLDGTTVTGSLNDLWKYDPGTGNWTWMEGSSACDQAGAYGTQGTPAVTNTPGGREYAVGWIDGSGALWLFGGKGYDSAGDRGSLNDLWKYDPASGNWTWVKGSNLKDQVGEYGTQGTPAPANTPGARQGSVCWRKSASTFCLFGGNNWSFVPVFGDMNDLWEFDTATSNWTWMQGSDSLDRRGVYGTRGVAAAGNYPGTRAYGTAARDATGAVWLFGGWGSDAVGYEGPMNDFWRYDPSTTYWTWMSGATARVVIGHYGSRGIPATANTPGGRNDAVSWGNGSDTLWVFGGRGHAATADYGWLNDLWKYDRLTGQWSWMKGSDATYQAGTYGSVGSPAPGNTPGGREAAVSWRGDMETLWLFGGLGLAGYEIGGKLNDLWRYDPVSGNWTWMKGSNSVGQAGTYGALGTPDPSNTPGGRSDASEWRVSSGELWLFGGEGLDTSGTEGMLNDLWRYDPATGNWTWEKGSSAAAQPGVYGTQGTTARSNTPGSRESAVSWKEASGILWLFGGFGNDGVGGTGNLNDLWKYDIGSGNWTWMKGSNVREQAGVYGTRGVPDPANTPGARAEAAAWIDESGVLWLFGGGGFDGSGVPGTLNDLWKYDPVTNNWTWVAGSSAVDQIGVCGIPGTQSPTNAPGGRGECVSWRDVEGGLWLLGGEGLDCGSFSTVLNDLWCYSPPRVIMRMEEEFSTDKTNMQPGGTTGWTPFGASEDNPVLDYDAANDALRITIATGSTPRVNGWMSANSEWLPYSSVGTDQYVRGKFYVFRSDQMNMSDLNQVPNIRLRLATRFAQNSMLEVFNHLSGDVSGTNAGRDLVMTDNPDTPSVYRVDFDPVDVPALAVAGEGVLRGFECYCLEPQENGAIELAEAWIGTYPAAALPDAGPDVLLEKLFETTPTDAGQLGVSDALADGPFFMKFILTAPGILGAQIALDGSTDPFYMENTTGVTLDSSLVASNRVGLVVREFTEMGDNTGRIRVEPDRQYKVRWHVLSNSNANTNPQLRLRSRALKFMWSQKFELGGALASGALNNAIAMEALPGVGTMNPDQQSPGENGGWYTLLMHTPMNPEIKPVQSYLASLPGPGSASTSMRDIKLGMDLLDTLSGSPRSVEESGWFTLIRIEMRAYDLVPD